MPVLLALKRSSFKEAMHFGSLKANYCQLICNDYPTTLQTPAMLQGQLLVMHSRPAMLADAII